MQKRRVSSSVLPVTESDAKALQNGKARKHRQRPRKGGAQQDLLSLIKLLVAIICIGFCVVALQMHFNQRKASSGEAAMKAMKLLSETYGDDTVKPLQEFTSLQYALDNSHIVALYFGASWCPMTTPVTELLDKTFRDVLLPPGDADLQPLTQRHGLSLVYISSDTSGQEMKDYLRPNWMSVPYDHADRNNLKRHFETAAMKEMQDLGMATRKREIPTLIIVSGESHQVLTYAGIEDVKEHGAQALDHWMELGVLNSALGSKFVDAASKSATSKQKHHHHTAVEALSLHH